MCHRIQCIKHLAQLCLSSQIINTNSQSHHIFLFEEFYLSSCGVHLMGSPAFGLLKQRYALFYWTYVLEQLCFHPNDSFNFPILIQDINTIRNSPQKRLSIHKEISNSEPYVHTFSSDKFSSPSNRKTIQLRVMLIVTNSKVTSTPGIKGKHLTFSGGEKLRANKFVK